MRDKIDGDYMKRKVEIAEGADSIKIELIVTIGERERGRVFFFFILNSSRPFTIYILFLSFFCPANTFLIMFMLSGPSG